MNRKTLDEIDTRAINKVASATGKNHEKVKRIMNIGLSIKDTFKLLVKKEE